MGSSFSALTEFLNTLVPPDSGEYIDIDRESLEVLDEYVMDLGVAVANLVDMTSSVDPIRYSARTGSAFAGGLDLSDELNELRLAYLRVTGHNL